MFEILKYKKYHFAFWFLVTICLSLIFGHSWGNVFAAACYVGVLTPVVIGVVYFFNFHLIPRYLIPRYYGRFALYCCLTIAVSLVLESYVIVFSFIWLSHFDFYSIAPNASDTVLLFVVLYLFVFVLAFFMMFKQYSIANKTIVSYNEERENASSSFLEFISDRKKVIIPYTQIVYIESLSDCIIIHTESGDYRSKERISRLCERLPALFLRIHRSFVVNKNMVVSCSHDIVALDGFRLPVGRSYRGDVKVSLGGV